MLGRGADGVVRLGDFETGDGEQVKSETKNYSSHVKAASGTHAFMTEIGRPHTLNGMQMNFPFTSQIKVAVKQVSDSNPDALRRLQIELNILCTLRSEYIVELYGSVVKNRDQAEFHS